MTHVRDLTVCCRCGAPIPEYVHGRGEWHYPRRKGPFGWYWAERGPYCNMKCLEEANGLRNTARG